MITVFTPAYNRRQTLDRLYKSLCRQTSFNFEWLVVDDGSIDNTKEFINSISEDRFAVRYYYQENGGKHRAINKGVKLALGEWFFIVDSDDYLTDDAISSLEKPLKEIELDNRFCGIVALKIDQDYRVIGTSFRYDVIDTDFITIREKYKKRGDTADVVRTSILECYPFPEIENEKFCTEAVVWNRIAQKYIARCVNKEIYICEYMSGGLTEIYEQIMDVSPYCSMIYCKELVSYNQVTFINKILFFMRYLHYCKIVKFRFIKDVYPTLQMFFLLPFIPLLCAIRYLKRKIFSIVNLKTFV